MPVEQGNGCTARGEVAAAYDAMAASYDQLIEEDAWMRRVLWSRHRRLFEPGDRVLDLGCGTGADSVALARRGVSVVAADVSLTMIATLRLRTGDPGQAAPIRRVVLDGVDVALFPPRYFDGIVSSFAAINTLSDLDRFASGAARVVRPGGRLLLHGLAPKSREGGVGPARTVTIAGRPVEHSVYGL